MSFLALLLTVSLMLGPIGRISVTYLFVPDLILLFLWASALLTTRSNSIRHALLAGLTLDVIMFTVFGLWTVTYLLVVLLIDSVKIRYIDVGSPIHALVVLILVSFVPILSISLVNGSIDLLLIAAKIIANAILGSIAYYLLVKRMKLLQRWTGRKL